MHLSAYLPTKFRRECCNSLIYKDSLFPVISITGNKERSGSYLAETGGGWVATGRGGYVPLATAGVPTALSLPPMVPLLIFRLENF